MTMVPEHPMFRYPQALPRELRETHEAQRIEVTHDAAVSFGFLRPRALKVSSTLTPEFLVRFGPQPLAVFSTPGRSFPRLGFSTHRLLWEVDPLEWLRWSAAREGWLLAYSRTHTSRGGPRYELATVREGQGGVVVRRTVALRSGSVLVRCDASAWREEWQGWHDPLWHALESFYLGYPSHDPIEAPVVHGGPLLGFTLPQSWEAVGEGDALSMVWSLRPRFQGAGAVALQVRATASGQAESAKKRRSMLWGDLAARSCALSRRIRFDRPRFAANVDGWVGQWQGRARTEDGDGAVVLVQREIAGAWVDYLLTAPLPGTDDLGWMRATRALDIAVATSQPSAPPRRLRGQRGLKNAMRRDVRWGRAAPVSRAVEGE